MHLSDTDVQRLMTDRSPEARAETVSKIAQVFDGGDISEAERGIAEDIFRAMVQDAEVRVRAALSESLKSCSRLPNDVALALAKDVDEVSLPVLECSKVLTDADLVNIIESGSSGKQTAIAQRQEISADLADALVESKNEDAVAALVANDGADIRESTLDRVLDEYSESDKVKTPLVHREQVPPKVAERLVAMVSDHLREHIVAHHELPSDVASDLILQSRERATMSLSSEDTVAELVRTLAENGRLTPSIITRALCMGDTPFFEWAMAVLGGLEIGNVRLLIHDQGSLGLKAVFDKTKLPQSMWQVVRVAVDIAHETEYDGADNDRERYAKRMIERIITRFEDPGKEFDADNLDYLLDKLTDLTRVSQQAA